MTGELKNTAPRFSRFSHADRRMFTPEAQPQPQPEQTLYQAPERDAPPQRGAGAPHPPYPPPADGLFEAKRSPSATPAARHTGPIPMAERRQPPATPIARRKLLAGLRLPKKPAWPSLKLGTGDDARIAAIAGLAAMRGAASRLRRGAEKAELRERYLKTLNFLHARIADRKFEPLFFHDTRMAGPADAADAGESAAFQPPAPRLAFQWAMAALPRDLKDYAFVDFRAQRGRAMMLAAARNFETISGYEYAPESFDELQMNAAQYPRSLMACRNVQCIRGDRDGLAIPDQPAVLYFSQAQRERFMALIMSHLSTSYRLNPRRIYLLLENPREGATAGQDDIFYKIEPPLRERALMRLFSPVKIDIYRSLV